MKTNESFRRVPVKESKYSHPISDEPCIQVGHYENGLFFDKVECLFIINTLVEFVNKHSETKLQIIIYA